MCVPPELAIGGAPASPSPARSTPPVMAPWNTLGLLGATAAEVAVAEAEAGGEAAAEAGGALWSDSRVTESACGGCCLPPEAPKGSYLRCPSASRSLYSRAYTTNRQKDRPSKAGDGDRAR